MPAADNRGMSEFRLVALLPLVVAAGCYSDTPSQSTLPQSRYVSGPPGGAIDPGPGGDQDADVPAYEADEAPTAADAPAPSEMPSTEAPVSAAPAPDPADPALAPPPEAPSDAIASVTDGEIDATLDGYGQWIETDDYGQVWRPDATVVGVDFTPYESGGSWQYTDAGWAFACDYDWGWLPFHYGRWAWFQDYWGWVPGYRWAPAWVEWRHGGGIVGWRPMAPRIRDHRYGALGGRDYHHGGGPLIRDHRHPRQHDAHWRFATVPDFGRPHIRSHLYHNPAEGLRVTSTVAAPPLRARTAVHPGDLMRHRFAAGSRPTQSAPGGYGGPQQERDHRASAPGRASQPTQSDRPTRYPPYNPPARTYQPPVRTQPYAPPARTYQPPPRSYNPPPRSYNPPPARTYQPPVRSAPPVRMHTPPARTFTPRAPSPPPARSWSPPASSGSSRHATSPPAGSSGSHASGGRDHRR